jgi:hypothetical protein
MDKLTIYPVSARRDSRLIQIIEFPKNKTLNQGGSSSKDLKSNNTHSPQTLLEK